MNNIRNISGFLPPYFLTELARRNPQAAKLYLDALANTADLWVKGHSLTYPVGSGQGDRIVYDAKGRTSLPGTKARAEGENPTADGIVNSAYDYEGQVRDFYRQVLKRNSLDGNGMDMIATVHYGRRYNNAFWNGSQMTYGDGDGDIFQTFVLRDVNGHECTHGMIEHTSGLEYYGQSGALNEHGADVIGVLINQWVLKQTADKADWLVGAGLFTPKINGRALRDMMNPGTAYDDSRLGKDPQPAHMKDYVDTYSDNGGVHYNSGIPNRAFALFAVAVGGFAWEKAGLIWFHSITKVSRNCQFQEFADKTVAVAKANFASDPSIVAKLRDAWKQVGITPAA